MNKSRLYKFLIITFFTAFSFNYFAHAEDPVIKIVNVVFVGEKESGKTYFREAIKGKAFEELVVENKRGSTDTICVSKDITFDIERNQHLRLMMYDTSGFEDIAEQVKNKLTQQANFVVLAIDGTKSVKVGTYYSYTDVVAQNQIQWYQQILSYNKYRENLRFIVLGTKSDLLDRTISEGMSESQYTCLERKIRSFAEGSRERVADYIMTSVTGDGYIGVEKFKNIIINRIREENLYDTLPTDEIELNMHDFDKNVSESKGKKGGTCVFL